MRGVLSNSATCLRFHQRVVPFGQQRLLQTTATNNTAATTAGEFPYGLKRIDYSSLPPLTSRSKPLHTLPPPPPHLYNPKNSIFISTIQPLLAPFCIAVLMGSMLYVYLYPEDDVYEYWKQVEQGNVPVDGADDHDDDDDDDDEDDDDDDDTDEWDDKK